MTLTDLLVARIRASGPITVAAFMDAALYHPEFGYYARAAQRSGKSGDFFTSVDVGPLFGELLAAEIDEMWRIARDAGATSFDLVEAGAGNGRLSKDILDAAAAHHRDLYDHVRLTLVERSDAARAAQRDTLGTDHGTRLSATLPTLPNRVSGVILANELLDALPVHLVTMTDKGLREIYVAERDGSLVETIGPIADPAIGRYLGRLDLTLPAGTSIEVGLAATQWIEEAARSLALGFILLIDYGYEIADGRAPTTRTLTAYRGHTLVTDWLASPGEQDLTAHVNLTAIRLAAEGAGLATIGIVDQTYFVIALGLADRLSDGFDRQSVSRRLAAKTLLMPGGLGSTMKVLAFARGLGRRALTGLSSGRLT